MLFLRLAYDDACDLSVHLTHDDVKRVLQCVNDPHLQLRAKSFVRI